MIIDKAQGILAARGSAVAVVEDEDDLSVSIPLFYITPLLHESLEWNDMSSLSIEEKKMAEQVKDLQQQIEEFRLMYKDTEKHPDAKEYILTLCENTLSTPAYLLAKRYVLTEEEKKSKEHLQEIMDYALTIYEFPKLYRYLEKALCLPDLQTLIDSITYNTTEPDHNYCRLQV